MVSKKEKDTVIILYKKGLSIRKIAADTLLASVSPEPPSSKREDARQRAFVMKISPRL